MHIIDELTTPSGDWLPSSCLAYQAQYLWGLAWFVQWSEAIMGVERAIWSPWQSIRVARSLCRDEVHVLA